MLLSQLPRALTPLLLLITTSTPASALPQSSTSTGQDAITAAYSNETNFRQNVIDVTNQYREQHNASKIAWNDTLAEFAEGVVDSCEFKHSVRQLLFSPDTEIEVGADKPAGRSLRREPGIGIRKRCSGSWGLGKRELEI
jgi:hypothetical protein